MSFNYQKLKNKQQSETSFWTSYADLFMVLSVVFLLLYVVSSLKTSTFSLQKNIEKQKLASEVLDMKKQIQAYNTLKDDYLEKEASKEEAQMYEELMSKLSLLQDEAKDEKRKLEQQANENELKAKALNQYQQMVRNIINTNLLSNRKIKFRNELITKKNDEIKVMDNTIQTQTHEIKDKSAQLVQSQRQIAEQEKEISQKQQALEQKKLEVANLNSDIQDKTRMINENQGKINSLNKDLSGKIAQLEKSHNDSKLSKAELSKQIAMLRLANAKTINELNDQTQTMQLSLKSANNQLSVASGQLQDAKNKIAAQENAKKQLEGELADASNKYKQKIADMENNFQGEMAKQKKALEGQLEREAASGAEKARRLAAFKEHMGKEKAALDKQLGELRGQVAKAQGDLDRAAKEANDYKGKLAAAQQEHGKYLDSIGKLQKENQGLSGDLKRAKELADAKRILAAKIARDLANKGIKAGVDGKNGDVTIQFGEEYFETGRSDLKPKMKDILQKFVPTYSSSLLSDPTVAKEIQSVEIIGFSSPTYQGRYIDPQSLAEKDRAAVSYNLDLSFNRAKSIFQYIFDKKNMSYTYQQSLLPMVKVTGRSYLAEEVKGRSIATGISHKDYCAKYNCEKSQKVIIKFNLKD